MRKRLFFAALILTLAQTSWDAEAKYIHHTQRRVASMDGGCTRAAPGSTVWQPVNVYSKDGILKVDLSYQTRVDSSGHTQFCYLTPDGTQSPTLHLNPGDRLILNLKNDTPAAAASSVMQMQFAPNQICGTRQMDDSSTNIHFHGTNVAPTCHQDDALHTFVDAGQTFTYDFTIPKDEPPGLYWYHPHVHGTSEAAVLGGASGAIIIDGIQNIQPEVAGLPEQVLVLRDNLVPGDPKPGGDIPSWDLSINFIPVPYPKYPLAVIPMQNGKELWRVVNAGADTILDLQLQYDGVAQPLGVVGLDGVPVGSQDDDLRGHIFYKNHIFLPPAARAEFISTAPVGNVRQARLVTLKVDTGPDGDNDVARPIALIIPSNHPPQVRIPSVSKKARYGLFAGLRREKVTATRKLFFSEDISNPNDPSSPTNFYITEDGHRPAMFAMANAPAITVTQGAVEDWTIENRTKEDHIFHIHQVHFMLLARNGAPVTWEDRQFMDIVDVPHWTGTGPYPNVIVRVDFRGAIAGDFVYHCHILQHEDNGMMAVIRVLPPK